MAASKLSWPVRGAARAGEPVEWRCVLHDRLGLRQAVPAVSISWAQRGSFGPVPASSTPWLRVGRPDAGVGDVTCRTAPWQSTASA